MPAQVKSFFDATGGLWVKGALVGTGVSIFTSTGTQGGGSETTVLTSLPNFVHHGMVYVPTGYSFGERLYDNSVVRGGTAYVRLGEGGGWLAAPGWGRGALNVLGRLEVTVY